VQTSRRRATSFASFVSFRSEFLVVAEPKSNTPRIHIVFVVAVGVVVMLLHSRPAHILASLFLYKQWSSGGAAAATAAAAAEEVEAQQRGRGGRRKELMLGRAGMGPRKGLGVAGLVLVAAQSPKIYSTRIVY